MKPSLVMAFDTRSTIFGALTATHAGLVIGDWAGEDFQEKYRTLIEVRGEVHVAAHDLAFMAAESGLVAHNAYEAALARLDEADTQGAFDWLQTAIECDAWLAERAGKNPRLWRLRNHPDYQSLVGPSA